MGISDLNTWNISDHTSTDIADSGSLSDFWPMREKFKSKSDHPKLKCPTFRSYTFRQDPPTDITEYYPLTIPSNLNSSDENSKKTSFHYVPVHDPLTWSNFEKDLHDLKQREEKIVEKLTLGSSSKSNFSLFDFNGDFFLKIIVLECYGNNFVHIFTLIIYIEDSISESPSLSTISFTIIIGSQRTTYILTTNYHSQQRNNGYTLIFFESECEMLTELTNIIITEDPDILAGFEVDNKSWGYVEKRYNIVNSNAEINFRSIINRNISKENSFNYVDPWIARASSQFQVHGRIVLNLWRIYRDEVALRSYSVQELCLYYFNIKFLHLSAEALLNLMNTEFYAFIKYILTELSLICDLVCKTPFLTKSVEFSRLFGIDFFSTLTRGSQYRVESILMTAAHSENYLLRTPTEADVRQMRAAQGLPLTMEPISSYYREPIIVLDFQSLYPSMIIAYNFCYSTIIGTVQDDKVISCGAVNALFPSLFNWDSFSQISDLDTFCAPGNILFVRKERKIGLLPRLLNEILSTRIAIKNAMKSCDSVKDFVNIFN